MPVDEKNKMILKLENISQGFIVKDDVKQVVDNVSMEVRDNEFLVVLGPGHCGKTVLMNIIAGLDKAVSGKVYLDGEEIHGSDSRIGMVFQSLNLMPWRTVMGNVEFGLEISGQNKATRRANAQKYIDLVGLTGFENSYPHQLSGGMKQRVAIARALAMQPRVLLMDEPFAALDALTRRRMQEELLALWEELRFTLVFVTHSIEEALVVGNRIAILSPHPGRVRAEVNSHQFDLSSQGSAEFQATAQRIHRLLFDEPASPAPAQAESQTADSPLWAATPVHL